MPYVDVNGAVLHYQDHGEGPPVLLIHGLAGDLSAWDPQVEALRSSHRVIAFDNRGAGQSTQREEAVSTLDMALDALALLDALGITRAHVVGRSMGGAIAQHMALQAPGQVASLVLCASFAKLDDLGFRVLTNMREVLEWRGSWGDHARHSVANFVSPRFFNDNPDIVGRIVSLIGSDSRLQACYVAQNHACLAHDTLADLHKIECPTLVLSGSLDPICSPLATSWLVEGIPNVQSRAFEGSSHFFLMEEADAFAEELAAWLRTHQALIPT